MPERLMSLRASLLAFVLGCGSVSCAQAQEIDETALRYYAAQGQTLRVEAEARRLSGLFPGWSMPEDIWSARLPMGDEEPLWELYAADDLGGLKRAIAQRQTVEPGWRPSDDLLRKIKRKEVRDQILSKAAKAQWFAVCDLASERLTGGFADDAALSWSIAEAYARCDRKVEARSIFSRLLQRSTDLKERRVTILKALGALPMADVEQLLDIGRKTATEAAEFSELANDLTRGRIAAILQGERNDPIDAAQLTEFETYAETSKEGGAVELLAWLALHENRLDSALKWFQAARARGADPISAHGLAQTLWRLGKLREAEDVAFNSRDTVTANMILFIDMFDSQLTKATMQPIEPNRLLRYVKVTLEARSGEGAQALGWYAYKSCQFATALDWFRRASAWLPRETTILGQAVSLQRLKKQKEFSELVNRYDGLFPTVVGLVFKDGSEALGGACNGPDKREQPRLEIVSLKGKASMMLVPQPSHFYNKMAVSSQSLQAKDFPISVAAENPLRFPESTDLKLKSIVARPQGPEHRPLNARRVSGVVAMPYERPDLKLSPGWNGESVPSAAPSVDSAPAQGTIASQASRHSSSAAGASGMLTYSADAIGAQAVALRLKR